VQLLNAAVASRPDTLALVELGGEQVTYVQLWHRALASLYRTGAYMFDGKMLIWEYPRQTPDGDQLDLVEVIELDGPLIAYHRIYWGWRGVEPVITNAVDKAVR